MSGDYGSMATRIGDEVKRSDLSAQILLEIQSAIQFYESEQFWFNQARTYTFPTVAGQEYYTSAASAQIPYILFLDSVSALINGNRTTLFPLNFDQMNDISVLPSSSFAPPMQYSYYTQALRLYPIPDQVYTVTLFGTFKLSTLSVAADTNAWMVEGEMLIRSRAKREVLKRYVRNPALAQDAAQDEAEALINLREATSRRVATGVIAPTWP